MESVKLYQVFSEDHIIYCEQYIRYLFVSSRSKRNYKSFKFISNYEGFVYSEAEPGGVQLPSKLNSYEARKIAIDYLQAINSKILRVEQLSQIGFDQLIDVNLLDLKKSLPVTNQLNQVVAWEFVYRYSLPLGINGKSVELQDFELQIKVNGNGKIVYINSTLPFIQKAVSIKSLATEDQLFDERGELTSVVYYKYLYEFQSLVPFFSDKGNSKGLSVIQKGSVSFVQKDDVSDYLESANSTIDRGVSLAFIRRDFWGMKEANQLNKLVEEVEKGWKYEDYNTYPDSKNQLKEDRIEQLIRTELSQMDRRLIEKEELQVNHQYFNLKDLEMVLLLPMGISRTGKIASWKAHFFQSPSHYVSVTINQQAKVIGLEFKR